MPIICIEDNLKAKGYLSIKEGNSFKGDYYIELLKENIEDDYELAVLNNNKGYLLIKLNEDTAETSNSEKYFFRGQFDNIEKHLENFDLTNVGLLLKCNSNPKDSIILYYHKKSFSAKDIQLIKNNNINKEYNKKNVIMNTTITNKTEPNNEKFANNNSNNNSNDNCTGGIDKEQNDEIACSVPIDINENITVVENKSIPQLETKDNLKEENIIEPKTKTGNKENFNSQINEYSQTFLSNEFIKKLKAKASLVQETSEYATTSITIRILYNSFKAIDLALNPYYVTINSVVSLFKYYVRKNKVILLNIVFKKFSTDIKTLHIGIPIGNDILNISGLNNINEYYFDENNGRYLIYKYDF